MIANANGIESILGTEPLKSLDQVIVNAAQRCNIRVEEDATFAVPAHYSRLSIACWGCKLGTTEQVPICDPCPFSLDLEALTIFPLNMCSSGGARSRWSMLSDKP